MVQEKPHLSAVFDDLLQSSKAPFAGCAQFKASAKKMDVRRQGGGGGDRYLSPLTFAEQGPTGERRGGLGLLARKRKIKMLKRRKTERKKTSSPRHHRTCGLPITLGKQSLQAILSASRMQAKKKKEWEKAARGAVRGGVVVPPSHTGNPRFVFTLVVAFSEKNVR